MAKRDADASVASRATDLPETSPAPLAIEDAPLPSETFAIAESLKPSPYAGKLSDLRASVDAKFAKVLGKPAPSVASATGVPPKPTHRHRSKSRPAGSTGGGVKHALKRPAMDAHGDTVVSSNGWTIKKCVRISAGYSGQAYYYYEA